MKTGVGVEDCEGSSFSVGAGTGRGRASKGKTAPPQGLFLLCFTTLNICKGKRSVSRRGGGIVHQVGPQTCPEAVFLLGKKKC